MPKDDPQNVGKTTILYIAANVLTLPVALLGKDKWLAASIAVNGSLTYYLNSVGQEEQGYDERMAAELSKMNGTHNRFYQTAENVTRGGAKVHDEAEAVVKTQMKK